MEAYPGLSGLGSPGMVQLSLSIGSGETHLVTYRGCYSCTSIQCVFPAACDMAAVLLMHAIVHVVVWCGGFRQLPSCGSLTRDVILCLHSFTITLGVQCSPTKRYSCFESNVGKGLCRYQKLL
jgi:hypothetical protein